MSILPVLIQRMIVKVTHTSFVAYMSAAVFGVIMAMNSWKRFCVCAARYRATALCSCGRPTLNMIWSICSVQNESDKYNYDLVEIILSLQDGKKLNSETQLDMFNQVSNN